MMQIIGLGCISSLGSGKASLQAIGSEKPSAPDQCFSEAYIKDTVFYQGDIAQDIASSAYKLAREACLEALRDCQCPIAQMALVIATGAGDTQGLELNDASKAEPYDTAGQLAVELGIGGVFTTVSNACSSAAYAMTVCEQLLDEGHDAVLLCGVEAKSVSSQSVFQSLLVLDPVSCRPFSEDRGGTVLGCGAAALVMTKQSVLAHSSYASVMHNALNGDAYHVTAPEPSGQQMQRCMAHALVNAGVSVDQIALLIPHATGTQLNDDIEARLLKTLFGDHYPRLEMLFLKRYLGHTGGASAAFSFVLAALKISEQSAYKDAQAGPYALVNSTAFGGNNSTTVLGPAILQPKQKGAA